MKQLSWEEYYDGFYDWSPSTQKRYAGRLSGYGPAEEVWEIAQELEYEDRAFAAKFVEKAFAGGVRFTPEQVLEMTDTLAADCTPTHYRSLFIRAWEKDESEHGLKMYTNARVTAIGPDSVTYVDGEGKEVSISADSVVISAGMKPKTEEALSYAGAGDCFYLLGDCKQVANLLRLNQAALGLAGLI